MEIELITEDQASERYSEMLDECYPLTHLCGTDFYPSQILKDCDPIAYRVYLGDYIDTLVEEGVYVEGYTDQDFKCCPECDEWKLDFRDTMCKDCDHQQNADQFD